MAQPAVSTPASDRAPLPLKRSVLRCVLCSVASLGVYCFFWFHQYRRRVSAELGRTDDAGLHTAGLLVPGLNYYLAYLLWRDIGEARRRVSLSDVPAGAYVAVSIFAAPVVFCLMASSLNEYWDRRTDGAATDAPFTSAERAVTFIPLAVFVGLIALVVGVVASS
jgi:hypothetical protein